MTKAEVDLESAGGDHGQSDTTPQNRGCCTWTRFLETITLVYFLCIGYWAFVWSWIGVYNSIFLRQISFFGLLPGKIEPGLKAFNGKLYPNLNSFSVCLCFYGVGGLMSMIAMTPDRKNEILVENGSSLKRVMRLPNFAYSMVSIFTWLDLLIVDWISEIIFYFIGSRPFPMFVGPFRYYLVITGFDGYGLLLRMDARLGILICCWIGKWLLKKFYKEAMTRFEK